ncbi:MAG: winged helix-turn-helix transcriptional regulator [Kiritimatiellaceae bacterium]|nr:winged helix-turn-helix transcriptional regulator [Kiritimatiellaceae bacterium]
MKTPLEILKALSDRNRLRVVAALMHNTELCACQLVELLGVSGATASRHMELLIRAGLVQSRKDGRWVHYRLHAAVAPQLIQWLETELTHSAEIQADVQKLKQITGCN